MSEPTPQQCLDSLYKVVDGAAMDGPNRRLADTYYKVITEAIGKPQIGDNDE